MRSCRWSVDVHKFKARGLAYLEELGEYVVFVTGQLSIEPRPTVRGYLHVFQPPDYTVSKLTRSNDLP